MKTAFKSIETQALTLCLLSFFFSQAGHSANQLNVDKIKSIECTGPAKVIFSTTRGGAEKYKRRNGFIPYSYQIDGFYNVANTGQMKIVRENLNSITLGDFTDYPSGPDVLHELELVRTNRVLVYKGYLTGAIEEMGQNYQLTRHPLNCRIQRL